MVAKKSRSVVMPAALRAAFDGRPPPFLLKGMAFVVDGGPVHVVEPRSGAEIGDVKSADIGGAAVGDHDHVDHHDHGGRDGHSDPQRAAALAELQAIGEKRAALSEDVRHLAGKLEDARQGIGSGGLALTVALGRLMQKHGLRPANPPPLALSLPIDAPSIRIRAIGATTDLEAAAGSAGPANGPGSTRPEFDCWW